MKPIRNYVPPFPGNRRNRASLCVRVVGFAGTAGVLGFSGTALVRLVRAPGPSALSGLRVRRSTPKDYYGVSYHGFRLVFKEK